MNLSAGFLTCALLSAMLMALTTGCASSKVPPQEIDINLHPLFAAISKEDTSLISQYIRSGGSLNVISVTSRSGPLAWAVATNNPVTTAYLIKSGAAVNSREQDGRTPLHRAATNGNLEIVNMLIANKARLNAKDNDGNTPMHWAVFKGKTDVVQKLISSGAARKRRNNNGYTPLAVAEEKKLTDIIPLLKR